MDDVGRLGAPEGDANPSSEPPGPEPIVAQARNDVSFSSEPSVSTRSGISEASSILTESSSEHTRPVYNTSSEAETVIDGGGPSPSHHAEPFFSGDRGTGNYLVGPRAEGRPRLTTERPVHAVHIGKITAIATKRINKALMEVAGLRVEDVSNYSVSSRKDQCQNILNTWMQRGDQPKKVFHLKFLLVEAETHLSEDVKDRFERIIRDIVRNPP